MNQLKFLPKLAITGVAGIAALAVPMKAEAAAFVIDNFNGDDNSNSRQVIDTTPGDGGVAQNSPIDPSNVAIRIDGVERLDVDIDNAKLVTTPKTA